MKHTTLNTLATLLDVPQKRAFDMSGMRLHDLAVAAREWRGHQCGNHTPMADDEALRFYLLNHLVSVIGKHRTPNEPLSEHEIGVVGEYRRVLQEQSCRVMYYMALICSREARHAYEQSHSGLTPTVIASLKKEMGEDAYSLYRSFYAKEYTAALSAIEENTTLTAVEWFKAVLYLFLNGKFHGGFGGRPWANITDCLLQALTGKISMEMMIDTSYTLAHNNGPMHNKGMLYSGFNQSFGVLLDVQRAGLLPELVGMPNQTVARPHIKEWCKQMVGPIKALYPDDFCDTLDVDVVMKRGALATKGYIEHVVYGGPKVLAKKKKSPVKKLATAKPQKELYILPSGTVVDGMKAMPVTYTIDPFHVVSTLTRAA